MELHALFNFQLETKKPITKAIHNLFTRQLHIFIHMSPLTLLIIGPIRTILKMKVQNANKQFITAITSTMFGIVGKHILDNVYWKNIIIISVHSITKSYYDYNKH